MKSIENTLKEIEFDIARPAIFEQIQVLEGLYYKLVNSYRDLEESRLELKYELDQLKNDDQRQLTSMSKKLNKLLRAGSEDEVVSHIMVNRATILDHFAMAYMAETGSKPSEIKMLSGMNSDGHFEIYFDKKSEIVLL